MKSWDVIVTDSSAVDFAAAVTASCKGLSVLMLEKAGQFGGISAISGGAVWLHDTDQVCATGKSGSTEVMKTYLRTIIGESQYREDLAETLVSAGREALVFLKREGAVKYGLRPLSPDYYPDKPGVVDVGRALEVVEYDGRELGGVFRDLCLPPLGMLLFGGMMVNRVGIQYFLNMRRSLRSLVHCTRLLLYYTRGRVKYPRGICLAMGNVLIARMTITALRKGMNLQLNVNVLAPCEVQGVARGVEIEFQEQRETLHARRGVVLVAGDFAVGVLAVRYRPHTREHSTMSPPANDGAALYLAAALSAREGTDRASNSLWAPVSVLTRADGSGEHLLHLAVDRAKPGVTAVNQWVVRFVNESSSYHHLASAMQDAAENGPCFLLRDAQAMKRHGLGLAHPAPVNNDALVTTGYLYKADTPAALAQQLGLDAQILNETVIRYNHDVAQGVDWEFAEGGDSYNRAMGDPGHQPDVCNAPLLSAPFYAIKLYIGDLGTSRGLVITADVQVVSAEGKPIAGLYVVGNDMDLLMVGTYPGPGITLGPGLTFGYLTACHLA